MTFEWDEQKTERTSTSMVFRLKNLSVFSMMRIRLKSMTIATQPTKTGTLLSGELQREWLSALFALIEAMMY